MLLIAYIVSSVQIGCGGRHVGGEAGVAVALAVIRVTQLQVVWCTRPHWHTSWHTSSLRRQIRLDR